MRGIAILPRVRCEGEEQAVNSDALSEKHQIVRKTGQRVVSYSGEVVVSLVKARLLLAQEVETLQNSGAGMELTIVTYMEARLLLLSLLFSLLPYFSDAQKLSGIDSLSRELYVSSLTCQREIYHQLAIEWFNFDKEKSLSMTKRELSVANQLEDSLSIIKSLRLMGQVLGGLQVYDSAIQCLSQAGRYAKQNGFNEEVIYAYQSLGRIYLFLGKFDECLRLFDECLSLREIEDEPEIKRNILNNTGVVYYKMRDPDKALENYFKALVLVRERGIAADVDQLLINIALCYVQKMEFQTGEYYVKSGLQECGEHCADNILMQADFASGLLYFEQSDLDHAEKLFIKSLKRAKAIQDTRYELDAIAVLCKIQLKRNNLSAARALLDDAKPILHKVPHNLEKREIYEQFVRYFQKSGDYINEVLYQRKYAAITDSLFAQQLAVNLMRLEGDVQKREAAVRLQAKSEIITLNNRVIQYQHYVIFSGAVAVVLLIVLLVSAYKRNKLRHRANILLDEKVRERTCEFDASIRGYAQESERRELVVTRHCNDLSHVATRIESIAILCKNDKINSEQYLSEICLLSQTIMEKAKRLTTESTSVVGSYQLQKIMKES